MTVPVSNDPRTYAIIGAAMEVHSFLGCGFAESVYQEAMEHELTARSIPFSSQPEVRVFYKGRRLNAFFRPDFICYDEIIVELKALVTVGGVEQSQILNYLKATRRSIGLLLNFGRSRLEFDRFINSFERDDPTPNL